MKPQPEETKEQELGVTNKRFRTTCIPNPTEVSRSRGVPLAPPGAIRGETRCCRNSSPCGASRRTSSGLSPAAGQGVRAAALIYCTCGGGPPSGPAPSCRSPQHSQLFRYIETRPPLSFRVNPVCKYLQVEALTPSTVPSIQGGHFAMAIAPQPTKLPAASPAPQKSGLYPSGLSTPRGLPRASP